MLRIAWFTPWSHTIPLRSATIGAACVSALTNPGARERWEVELFMGDDDLAELRDEDLPGIKKHHYLRAADRHRALPFDLFIYNIEDHPRCRFIAEMHHSIPGLVLAHDINLNRLAWARFAHTTAPTEINQEIDELFGRSAPRLGDAFVRGWPLDAFDRIYRRGNAQLNRAQRLLVSEFYLLRSLNMRLSQRSSVLHFPLECFAAEREPLATNETVRPVVLIGDALARPQTLAAFRALELLQNDHPTVWLQHAADPIVGAPGSIPASVEIRVAGSVPEYQRTIANAAVVVVPGVDEFRGIGFAAATALASGAPTIIWGIGAGEPLPNTVALKMARIYGGTRHADDALLLSKLIASVLEKDDISQTLSSRARSWVQNERGVCSFCEALRGAVREELASLKMNRRVTERRYLAAQALHVHTLMERLDASDLWREDDGAPGLLFNSVLRAAIRDFEWLDAPTDTGVSS